MAGNNPSQKLDTGYPLPTGKENRPGPGARPSQNEGDHGAGTGDRATKFTPDPREKQGDSPAL